ncbi:MAG: hypothetical protein MUE31_02700 [Candidatus Nanopelagicales bacterium]|nr:hypothetical protein [Candidatus Nanopelagicales bacterium]
MRFGTMNSLAALAAGVLSMPLLAGCGDGANTRGEGIAEPAPSDFGDVDFEGDSLQCATDTNVAVTARRAMDYVGHESIMGAAEELIVLSMESDADRFRAATSLEITAAQAQEGSSNSAAEVHTVQVDATNAEGRVVGVILVASIGEKSEWQGVKLLACDGGSTK